MEIADKKRFLTILSGIADYYGKELSDGIISLYWEGLKQYDIKAIEKALWAHTQNPDNGQFMPKIADVMKFLQGRTIDQASVAWSKVDSTVRRIGGYQDVVFDDEIIHKVIEDMGGWISFNQKTEDEWKFIGNQFITRYQGYRIQGGVSNYLPVMIGMANAHNAKEGHKTIPPVFIGNSQNAEKVMLSGNERTKIEFTKVAYEGKM